MSVHVDAGPLSGDDTALEAIRHICVALGRRGTIQLLRELSGGYTGTRVFLAEEQKSPDDPQHFQLVFKVGPGRLLRKEVERYRALLPHARAHKAFAALVEPERTLDSLPDSHLPGAIVYEHVAAPFALKDSVSLKERVAQAIRGEVSLGEVEEILATTVAAIGSLYGTPEFDFAFLIARFYLDRWTPDFRLAVDEVAEVGGQCLLTRRRLNPARFPEEQQTAAAKLRQIAESPAADPQIDLVIPQLSPIYSNETAIFFHGPTSDVLSLEVDLTGVSWEARQKVAASRTLALWASASAEDSRYGVYRHRLREAFPDWEPELPSLSIGGQVLQNPLQHLSRPLIEHTGSRARTLLAPAHGDLHPGNVLVVGTMPVIIDYGLSELRSPVGTDATRLLGGIVRDVLSELLSPEEICSVLLALLELEDHASPPKQDTPSWRAWKLLQRLQAESMRISGESLEQLWPLHLYSYAFIGLKWTATSKAQHQACGLLAAAALTKLLGRPKVEHLQVAPGRDIKPEGPAEILIVVARFAGSAEYDPTSRIYEALADHLFEVIPDISRVEQLGEIVSSRKEAIELANRYEASMVVWGTYDGFGIRPRYEVTRDSIVLKKSMIQLDQATRHKLKEKFDIYITENLAAEISFLSLQAVGDMCVLNLNYEAAVSVYERVLALIADSERLQALGAVDIYQSLTGVYISQKKLDKAVTANQKARELAPEDILLQFQLLLLRSMVEQHAGEQIVEEMRSFLQERIESGLINVEQREGLSAALAVLDSYKSPKDIRAIVESSSAKRDPLALPGSHRNSRFSKDVIVHLTRVQGYLKESRFSEALKECRVAIRLNPICVPALVYEASCLAYLDRVPQALRSLDHAERIDPSSAATYFIRAKIFVAAGRYSETLGMIENALSRGLIWELGFYTWGESMLGLGRGDEMMAMLKSRPPTSDDSRLFLLRAKYYRQQEQYVAALREVNEAVALSSEPSSSYEERGRVYVGMGEFTLAVEDLERSLRLYTPKSFSWKKCTTLLEELRAIEGLEDPAVRSARIRVICSHI